MTFNHPNSFIPKYEKRTLKVLFQGLFGNEISNRVFKFITIQG